MLFKSSIMFTIYKVIFVCIAFISHVRMESAETSTANPVDPANEVWSWQRYIHRGSESLQLAGNDAENEIDKGLTDYLKSIKSQVIDVVETAAHYVPSGCQCVKYECGCCGHLEEEEIHLNSTICVNVTYLVQDYGISFTLMLDDHIIYNETVSARNPPPVCLGMPFVKDLAELCIRLYDINATRTNLHACVRAEARMKRILLAKYDLGCFDLGPPFLNKMKHLVHDIENEVVPSVLII